MPADGGYEILDLPKEHLCLPQFREEFQPEIDMWVDSLHAQFDIKPGDDVVTAWVPHPKDPKEWTMAVFKDDLIGPHAVAARTALLKQYRDNPENPFNVLPEFTPEEMQNIRAYADEHSELNTPRTLRQWHGLFKSRFVERLPPTESPSEVTQADVDELLAGLENLLENPPDEPNA